MSAQNVPRLYRTMFLWFDPAFMAAGTFVAIFMPALYLDTMTPHAAYDPRLHQVLLNQVGAVYLLMAFNSSVVLRVTNDLKVWKTVLAGIWICDMVHIQATFKELGVEVFLNPLAWRPVDSINLAILMGMMVLRIAFIFEVGFQQRFKTD